MAQYIARILTPKPAEEAFAYMADLRNFAEWDPGVVSSQQVAGDGPGLDAAYDVTVRAGSRKMTLRYVVTEYNAPKRIEVVGKTKLLTSTDVIEVSADGDETLVVYDAKLDLPFPLSLGDALLSRTFDKIGDKAAAGMEQALDGTLLK
jgi:carbon monoxide dehydrogenase subunit G